MDEAGMADSERLPKLIELTAASDSKLLLAGDSAQPPSIGAGGLFKELQENAPTAELREVHRRPPRLGEAGMDGDPKRTGHSCARALPSARPSAHPRHPRAGHTGDGRELGPP